MNYFVFLIVAFAAIEIVLALMLILNIVNRKRITNCFVLHKKINKTVINQSLNKAAKTHLKQLKKQNKDNDAKLYFIADLIKLFSLLPQGVVYSAVTHMRIIEYLEILAKRNKIVFVKPNKKCKKRKLKEAALFGGTKNDVQFYNIYFKKTNKEME